MVTPEALLMAPPARLMGLLPKKRAGRTQFSRNFCINDTLPPNSQTNGSQLERGIPPFEQKALEGWGTRTSTNPMKLRYPRKCFSREAAAAGSAYAIRD